MRLASLLPSAEIDVTDLVEEAGFAQSDRGAKTIASFCPMQFQDGLGGLG
jgi:hypothetical protein